MANLIYAEQRNVAGQGVYEYQVESATVEISATLISNAAITSTMGTYYGNLAAGLVANSAVAAFPLLLKSRLASALNSTADVVADLRLIKFETSASLSVSTNVTATLRLLKSELSSDLFAASSISGALGLFKSEMFSDLVVGSSISAILVASSQSVSSSLVINSTLLAKLYATLDSNIPDGAIVKAVPSEAEHKNIVRYRGDTYPDSFIVFNDRTGEMIDLTNCTLKLTLSSKRVPKIEDDLVYTLSGVVDSNNKGIVHFAPNTVDADRVGFYWYEIELKEPQGVVRTLLTARYVYKQDIVP